MLAGLRLRLAGDGANAEREDNRAAQYDSGRNDGDVLARERAQQRQPDITDHRRAEHHGKRRDPRERSPHVNDASRHVSGPGGAANTVS